MVVRLETGLYTNWSETTVSGSNLKSIVYADNKYVAVSSSSSKIFTSSNGTDWTSQTVNITVSGSARTIIWLSVIYANNKFMAVGYWHATSNGAISYIATSTDGSSWTVNEIGTGRYSSIAYGSGTYVVVGEGYDTSTSRWKGQLATSSNGTTWTTQSAISDNKLSDVCYGNNKFVAVGEDIILTSTNGSSWSTVVSGHAHSDIHSVIYGNNNYVIAGKDRVLTSSDGSSWTSVTLSGLQSVNDINYINNEFVCVWRKTNPFNICLAKSSNGSSWAVYDVGMGSSSVSAVSVTGKSNKLTICAYQTVFNEKPSQINYMLTTKSGSTVKNYVLTTKQSGTVKTYI